MGPALLSRIRNLITVSIKTKKPGVTLQASSLKTKKMIWFSSDFHLGHQNIAGPKVSNWPKGYRDFENTHKMDSTIMGNINGYVKQEDTLYFLGDFCLGGVDKIRRYYEQMICKNVIFILGNHDKRKEISKVFGRVCDVAYEEFSGISFHMSHYAHRVWPKSHRGSIHLYGHSHNTLEGTTWGKSMDVGIDSAYALTGEYKPFSLEEILKIMDSREIKFIDHHKERQ